MSSFLQACNHNFTKYLYSPRWWLLSAITKLLIWCRKGFYVHLAIASTFTTVNVWILLQLSLLHSLFKVVCHCAQLYCEVVIL
jgi:hypothetical protein